MTMTTKLLCTFTALNPAGYNQTAHRAARREVQAFLNEHLASKLPEYEK
ncbi:MAG: hypothetical protein O7B27_07675 [Gammaproteobacteria bacterium]|nr:hypothetical protein [Gammaproteobacteria bacterium]